MSIPSVIALTATFSPEHHKIPQR